MKNKYLFVIPTLSNGGAERVISVLSSELSIIGKDVSVVVYYRCLDEYRVNRKVRIISMCEDKESYSTLKFFGKIKKLRSILKSEAPDYVIPFMYRVALITAIAALFIRTNVIHSIRINPYVAPASRFNRYIRDTLVYQAKCTFVQNEQQRQYFKEKARKKIHVLYNPISDDMFDVVPNYNNGKYVVCSVGRLESQKNFKLLIDSFSFAFPKVSDAVLYIYGEGSCRKELEQYIREKKLQNRVFLKGRTTNIIHVYQNSDLFVLSSDFEGMPNALLEAMACGLPCISTDCPTGPSDLIESGENGLLVPVHDAKEMSGAMQSMYSNLQNAHQIGLKAKESVRKKCKAANIVMKMVNICESIK